MNEFTTAFGLVLAICAGGSEGPFFPYLNLGCGIIGLFLFSYFGNKIKN